MVDATASLKPGILKADSSPWMIAVASAASLAVAVGIGRFAFTPLLPMMLSDGVIDLHQASWLASANYLGYLIGALLCMIQPWLWLRLNRLQPLVASHWVRGGLVVTALLTFGMALHLPSLWPVMRFSAGVSSAIVFVFTSSWSLSQLARRNASAMGGLMYAGPGAGIALSGLLASGMVAWHWTAATGWLIFGTLACLLTAGVWRTFNNRPLLVAAGSTQAAAANAHGLVAGRNQMLVLAGAYGLAGFGYIITATFLPVIARQALPGSAWLDLFWPLFGLSIVVGCLLATRVSLRGDLRYVLAGCYAVQALGVVVPAWSSSLAGFVLGSVLLGIPFTAITFFVMQEVRRLRPFDAASNMGLVTAVYGVGQISGPPMVAMLLQQTQSLGAGFNLSLEIAAAALLLGAAVHLWMVRAYPMQPIAPVSSNK